VVVAHRLDCAYCTVYICGFFGVLWFARKPLIKCWWNWLQVPCQEQQLQLYQSTGQAKLFLPLEDSSADLYLNRNLTSWPELPRKNIRTKFCIGLRPRTSGHRMRSNFHFLWQVCPIFNNKFAKTFFWNCFFLRIFNKNFCKVIIKIVKLSMFYYILDLITLHPIANVRKRGNFKHVYLGTVILCLHTY